jgi:transglutaminase-like putative cysteine protease
VILTIDVKLDYGIVGPAPVLLQIEAAETADQRLVEASLKLRDTAGPVRVAADEGIGTRAWVTVTERLRARYHARVEVRRTLPDLARLGATALPELPGETFRYLMGSRFVAPEKFEGFANKAFDGLAGGARVAMMRDWVEESLSYVPGSSDAATTAVDTFVERQGICRDYAHLLIALCRASRIPARFASVYAPSVEPPDFHAVAEVWMEGAWHLLDPTGMADAAEMAVIGVGRDAADVGFLLAYAPSELKAQSVSVEVE